MSVTTNKSGPINGYKGVVKYLEKLCKDHLSINQFQVGELSDVDVQVKGNSPTRYPLVFAIPQTSTVDRNGKVVFGFSLIVADIAKNEEDLETNIHNSTFMIIQDLLSKIALSDWKSVDMAVEFPVSVTPFVERFNSNLAGWTAELNIEIKSPLDLCTAPFN